MARYKRLDYDQGQFIPIRFDQQILAGSFEQALSYVVDEKLDFSVLDAARKNDDGGAPAYDPRVMLKIVLWCYSRGIVSSRDIEAACGENVLLMALSANTRPHFTTVAQFIRELGPAMQGLFVDVLLYCDELGLIGGEMFAVDGCKFPGNASKEWSGTRADFEKKRAKFQARVDRLVSKHRTMDDKGEPEAVAGMRAREEKAIETMKKKTERIDAWLRENPEDKMGARGMPVKSSMTDKDSAKMMSSHGVIQGYNAVAAADAKHQVIVGAEAYGTANEAAVLGPMLEQVRETFKELGTKDIYRKVKVTADSGFHTEESMKALFESGIDGYVPDKRFRLRDPAFQSAQRHRDHGALPGRADRPKARYFKSQDFRLDAGSGRLICPAGKELHVRIRDFKLKTGFVGTAYRARVADCRACELKARCLRNPASPARSVHIIHRDKMPKSFSQRMIRKLEGGVGRFLYGMRMGIVEPVFANLRYMRGLSRFTLRSAAKVNVQWRLYALVHNLGKAYRFGWAGA